MSAINSGRDSTVAPKNGRRGKPKVRTGCITCKVRRIKCDEGKPFCSRCTSTGRHCDGYDTEKRSHVSEMKSLNNMSSSSSSPDSPAIKFPPSDPLSNRMLEYTNVTSRELRFLEVFGSAIASKLSGWSSEKFWKHQIPQTSYSEPSIRHAMIAMASTYEQFQIFNTATQEGSILDPTAFEAQQRFADWHHTMAISELSKLLSASPDSTEIALINCALFVMLDFVRGNFATAVLHLHSGLEILGKWQKESLDGTTMVEGSLEANIVQVFHHLSFNTSLNGRRVTEHGPDHDLDSPSFSGLSERRISALELDVATHRVELDDWLMRFEALPYCTREYLSDEQEESVQELRIIHLSALMWLEAGPGSRHIKSEDRFEIIVDLADTLHHLCCPCRCKSRWTRLDWEVDILPPVYFLATKCQDPAMKGRALRLLMKGSP